MDSRAADLLAAVIADPTDDAARLVYADHLMERGDPRGEMIRLHVALVDLSPAALRAPDRKRARRRLYQLRSAYDRTAIGAPHVFRRGLVDEILLSIRDLRRRARALFADHPITRLSIEVHDDTDLREIDAIAPLIPPTVAAVRLAGGRTATSGRFGEPATCVFAGQGAALFAGRDVTFSRFVLTATSAPALVHSLAGARGLGFEDGTDGSALVRRLADSAAIPKLARLALGYTKLTADDGAALETIGARPDLVDVSWHENPTERPAPAHALLARSRFARVATHDGDASVFAHPAAASIRRFDCIGRRELDLEALLASPHARDLEELRVRELAVLTPEIAAALAGSRLQRVVGRTSGTLSPFHRALPAAVPHIAFLHDRADHTSLDALLDDDGVLDLIA